MSNCELSGPSVKTRQMHLVKFRPESGPTTSRQMLTLSEAYEGVKNCHFRAIFKRSEFRSEIQISLGKYRVRYRSAICSVHLPRTRLGCGQVMREFCTGGRLQH